MRADEILQHAQKLAKPSADLSSYARRRRETVLGNYGVTMRDRAPVADCRASTPEGLPQRSWIYPEAKPAMQKSKITKAYDPAFVPRALLA